MAMNDQNAVSGRKTFLAGSIVFLLFAAVHGLAVYDTNFNPPRDEKLAEIQTATKAYVITMGPFKPSVFGLTQILSLSYTTFLLYFGTINLLALRPAAQAGRLRALTLCNILFVAMLFGITILYQFPPPMLFSGVALALFCVSWWKQGKVEIDSSQVT